MVARGGPGELGSALRFRIPVVSLELYQNFISSSHAKICDWLSL